MGAMGLRGPFRSRLCLVTDIEGYSTHPAEEQGDAQRRLLRVMQFACGHAGILRVSRQARQDRGDGQLLLMPPRLDLTRAVPALVTGLRHALYLSNRESGPFGRMRIRAAMAHGAIAYGPTGYLGKAPITACRLVDAQRLKDALKGRQSADLAFIAPDDLYRDVIEHDLADLPAREFSHTDVAVKEYAGIAWMYLPETGPVLKTTAATQLWAVAAAGVMVAGLVAGQSKGGGGLGGLSGAGHEEAAPGDEASIQADSGLDEDGDGHFGPQDIGYGGHGAEHGFGSGFGADALDAMDDLDHPDDVHALDALDGLDGSDAADHGDDGLSGVVF